MHILCEQKLILDSILYDKLLYDKHVWYSVNVKYESVGW